VAELPDRDLIKKVFSYPDLIPEEFKNWMRRYLEIESPNIILSQLAGQFPYSRLGGVQYGRSSAHFNASAVSDTKTVNHNLGKTPSVVLLTGEDSGTSVIAGSVYVTSSTNFTCRFRDVDGNARGPGDLVFNWIAIA
jgi:hypothetical protein